MYLVHISLIYKRNFIYKCFLLLAIFKLIACTDEKDFKVIGKFNDHSNEWVYLKELTLSDVLVVDSVKVTEKGKFVIKGKSNKIAFYSLQIERKKPITLVIRPGDKINLTIETVGSELIYNIEGSDDSRLAKILTDKVEYTLKRVDSLNKIYNDSLGSPNIMVIRNRLDSMFNVIRHEQIEFTRAFINENKNSLVTIMALYQQITPRKSLLSPVEHYDLFKQVDSIMMLQYPEADAVKSLHQMMTGYTEEYIRKIETQKRTAIGAVAPEISMLDFNNQQVNLSSLRGKYVLVDFWASWCNSCRELNQYLKTIYWRYKNKGFEIYQISLDRNRQAWINAITIDGLPWINVTDLKMWDSPVVPLFGIEEIPYLLLLDSEGKILLKNPDKTELSEKLKQIFGY